MKDISEIIPFGEYEPEKSRLAKQLYVMVQYADPLHKISYNHFLKNIKEYCKIHGFEWTCRDEKTNRRLYPNRRDNAGDWFDDYDYLGAYRVYADYMNPISHKDSVRLMYNLENQDIRTLFVISHNIFDDIQKYQIDNNDGDGFDAKYVYKLKALIESYKIIMEEIRERLSVLSSEAEDSIVMGVVDLEDDEGMEYDLELLTRLMDKDGK